MLHLDHGMCSWLGPNYPEWGQARVRTGLRGHRLVRGGKDLPVGSKPVRLRWPQAEPDDTYERLSSSLVGDSLHLGRYGLDAAVGQPGGLGRLMQASGV